MSDQDKLREAHTELLWLIEPTVEQEAEAASAIVGGMAPGWWDGKTLYPFMVDGERNPALEWVWLTPQVDYYSPLNPRNPYRVWSKELANHQGRWVAVGVKDTTE